VSPAHKREVAESMVREGKCSGRQVCRYFRMNRSSYRYQAKEPSVWMVRLRQAVWQMSVAHSELGYPKIARMLRNEGWQVGKDLVARLRCEMGLKIPPKAPKKRRKGPSTGRPIRASYRGHVWSWDFIYGRTERGGTIKILSIIDEYTRECHRLHVGRRINAAKVKAVMNRLVDEHGAPGYIRSDNGSEFIEKHLRAWLAECQIKTIYIDPGSPWQNGYVESFHGKFRRECLAREELWSLSEARVVIENWRYKYNVIRPHRSLQLDTPWEYASKLSSEAQDSGRPTAFLRPELDSLYRNLNHNYTLTSALGLT